MVSKKGYLLLSIAALLSIPGCRPKKRCSNLNKHKQYDRNRLAANHKSIDIPLADQEATLTDEQVASFFNDETEEFLAYDNQHNDNQEFQNQDGMSDISSTEYAWIDKNNENEFKNIYFDFNQNSVRADQKETIQNDITAARTLLDDARNHDENPTFVIEGHACNSAGVATYNTALSGKRANAVAEMFVAEGIPQENIKVVERGHDFPLVDGNREQQWPNRRVEVKVIYS